MDAGGLAHMNYNNSNNGFAHGNLGVPGAGFGGRNPRLNSKRLSVALPPKVSSIGENQVENPTPRTSRSHLLAGLRTQPKTPAVPASAPYNQTQHDIHGLGNTYGADQSYNRYNQGVPQTAVASQFDISAHQAMNAGRQMYSLPEQVLAPPSFHEKGDEMDPSVLQQMQMTSLFLAQRQQQLQLQLANITAAANQFQGMNLNTNVQQPRMQYHQSPMTPQTPQAFFGQPQQQLLQSPIEVQPGVYIVYNPATQGYNYAYDQNAAFQMQNVISPSQQTQMPTGCGSTTPPTPSVSISPPPAENVQPLNTRSISPPKKAPSPPSLLDQVTPLPPPSATAFRRGHKKASSLAINPNAGSVIDGMKTSSAATFGNQRSVFPPTPMTGTFGPGAARAGEHPLRQPRGPPSIDELKSAPTSMHEGSKNFVSRQRRRALDNLAKAGAFRRGVSRSNDASPASEADFNFGTIDEADELSAFSMPAARKMSPIGSEMKEKRNSQGSSDGYFGLSSASSSEGEDGAFKQPPTPATPIGGAAVGGGDRKRMVGGLLNAVEKRKTFAL